MQNGTLKMDQIRISAKNLGALALGSFCPRCFWIKMHCPELPYQIFPGIFSSIDSYTKKVTNIHFQKTSRIPAWLEPFGDIVRPVKTPTLSTFYVVDPETNIKLTGVPDEVFQRKDGSYFIADYKTAKYTGNQDKLLPMYDTQLNGYAFIGERTGLKPVTGLGLVYYEPQTDLKVEGLDSILLSDGFMMSFIGKLLPIELRPDTTIPALLKRVRQICDLEKSPQGTAGCEDCEKVSKLIEYASR
jgi:hypothetical protein